MAPKAKPEEVEGQSEVSTEEAEAPVEKKASKPKATSAAVNTAQGAHIRTYTLAHHGEDFADLAKEFSDHTPNSTVTLA